MRFRSNTTIALLILLAVVFAAYADILVMGRGLYLNDLTSYHFPMKRIVREVIAHGEFPFWNRFYSGGQPLAANPAYEVFYPPQWLLYVLPFAWAFQLHIVLHFFLAAVAMFFLLRDLEVRPPAALFGALAFVLGGPYLSLSTRLPLLFAMSWMPLVLLCVRRTILRRTAGAFTAAVFSAAMQLIIGEPTVVIQTWAIIGGYGIYTIAGEKKMRPVVVRRIVLALAAVAVGAALVAAVQLVPGLDHARDSVRSRPFEFVYVSNWSTPFVRIFEVFLPDLFRHVADSAGAAAITTMYPYRADAFLAEIYVGLLVVVLALAGIINRLRGWGAALTGVVFSVIAAAGDHTPLLRILYEVHLVRALRYPEKFLLSGAVVLAVWAAVVLDRLIEGDRRLFSGALLISGVWFVLSLFLLSTSSDNGLGARSYFGLNVLRAAIVCGLFLFGRKRHGLAWAGVLVAVLAGDLWLATARIVPRMPSRYFDTPPIAAQLPPPSHEWRIYHVAGWETFDNAAIGGAYFQDAGAPAFWWMFRNGMFPDVASAYGYEMALENDIDLTSLVATDDFREALKAARKSLVPGAEDPYLRMSNVGAQLRFRPVIAGVEQAIKENAERVTPVEVVRGPTAPRYWFAGRLEQIRDAGDFRDAVARNRDDSAVAYSPIPSFHPAAGEVLSAAESANTARIAVRTAGTAFLVTSVTGHKYWSASIDDKPAKLVSVNLAYQGMVVPAGSHVIRMRYSNPLVELGGAISLITVMSLLAYKRRGSPLFI
jgi:hypothetical protein